MSRDRYTPYYCEENTWWTLQGDELQSGAALFITNAAQSVAVWSQRASPRSDGLILWDYHVVAAGLANTIPTVVDPDCTAGRVLTLEQWFAASFPFAGALPPEVEPAFRVVVAEDLFADFRTDRSHMLDSAGAWLHAPPTWPPLADTSNLAAYLDVEDPAPGPILSAAELLRYW